MKLNDLSAQSEWLGQHIPHRLRASLAQTVMLENMVAAQYPSKKERAKKLKFCLDMAAWEGRHAATRWLIDFVGVNGDSNGSPTESSRRKGKKAHVHDVDITDLPGGVYFPLGTSDAELLGAVWKGCSQATSHATSGSNHPSVARDKISQAVLVVVRHLNDTIYKEAGAEVTF